MMALRLKHDEPAGYFLIFTSQIQDLIRTESAIGSQNLPRVEQLFGPTGIFPDGSMNVRCPSTQGAVDRLWAALGLDVIIDRYANAGPPPASGVGVPNSQSNTIWASIPPMIPANYKLFYTTDYFHKLTEAGFLVFPNYLNTPGPEAHEVSDLAVTVSFIGRITKAVRAQFGAALAEWAASVRAAGIFGEGPARICSPDVAWRGRMARFHINAAASGQNTVNWLILSLLNFGYQFTPVEEVVFGRELGEPYDQQPQAVISAPLPAGAVAALGGGAPTQAAPADAAEPDAVEPPGGEEEPSPIPDSAKPIPQFSTARFKVLETPDMAWDTLEVRVVLNDVPDQGAQRRLNEIVAAWQTLAESGGFGGLGLHRAQPLVFKENSRVGAFYADMGDVPPAEAMTCLVKALEGFDRTERPGIEAVVFSKGSPLP